MSATSLVAAIAIAQLPLTVVSVGNLVSSHRLASKVIDKVGDRTRVVAPQKEQQPGGNREAKGYQRDANGRFAKGGPIDLDQRRTGT
jgi:hypothetical protein